ncbi:hypothetical protein AB7M38_003116 [Bradyrhizobium diazoefficiens]
MSRPSMVSVTDLARVSNDCSSAVTRPPSCWSKVLMWPSIVLSRLVILPFSESSRLATRSPTVVSNCIRRWSSTAVIRPPCEVKRVSKLST